MMRIFMAFFATILVLWGVSIIVMVFNLPNFSSAINNFRKYSESIGKQHYKEEEVVPRKLYKELLSKYINVSDSWRLFESRRDTMEDEIQNLRKEIELNEIKIENFRKLASLNHSDNNKNTASHITKLNTLPDIKIYVYDLPSAFNSDILLRNRKCSHRSKTQTWQTKYSTEVYFHETLMNSPIRTTDPEEADFFYIPAYISCFLHSRGTNFILTEEFVYNAMLYIKNNFPFWIRRHGRDHVWMMTHDIGSCVAPVEAIKNSIVLTSTGELLGRDEDYTIYTKMYTPEFYNLRDFSALCFSPWKDIVIPPMLINNYSDNNGSDNNNILASFRGAYNSYELYSRGVRQRWGQDFNETLCNMSNNHDNDSCSNSGIRITFIDPSAEKSTGREYKLEYINEMKQSKFCLCPPGWASWTPRVFESLMNGCVPIVVTEANELPFELFFPARLYSIQLPEDISSNNLTSILKTMDIEDYNTLHKNGAAISHHMSYNLDKPIPGDAFYCIINSLFNKIHIAKI